MLKVKDWPPRSAFTQEMQRHFVVSPEAGWACLHLYALPCIICMYCHASVVHCHASSSCYETAAV
jgi:hypothetical protein